MPKKNLRYLIAGIIGAGAVVLATAGASAHLGSVKTLSDDNLTPAASGAAADSTVVEADTMVAAQPASADEADSMVAAEPAAAPDPTETVEPEAPEVVPDIPEVIPPPAPEQDTSNVDVETDTQGQSGDESGDGSGDNSGD